MGLFPLLIILVIIVAAALMIMRRAQDKAMIKRIMDVKTQSERAFSYQSEPIDGYGDAFLEALRDADWQHAYDQLTQALRDKLGTSEQLQKWIESGSLHLKDWKYQSRVAYRGIVNPDTGESQLDGGLLYSQATFVDGRQGGVSLTFITENRQLRVSEVKMDGRNLP